MRMRRRRRQRTSQERVKEKDEEELEKGGMVHDRTERKGETTHSLQEAMVEQLVL